MGQTDTSEALSGRSTSCGKKREKNKKEKSGNKKKGSDKNSLKKRRAHPNRPQNVQDKMREVRGRGSWTGGGPGWEMHFRFEDVAHPAT